MYQWWVIVASSLCKCTVYKLKDAMLTTWSPALGLVGSRGSCGPRLVQMKNFPSISKFRWYSIFPFCLRVFRPIFSEDQFPKSLPPRARDTLMLRPIGRTVGLPPNRLQCIRIFPRLLGGCNRIFHRFPVWFDFVLPSFECLPTAERSASRPFCTR